MDKHRTAHTFSSWLHTPTHQQWLGQEGRRLLGFARAARLENGFGDLDDYGRLMVGARAQTLNTARLVHCFSLAHIQGIPGFADLIDHGLAALLGPLRDELHGGWFDAPLDEGGNSDKQAYLHAFVALAGSSAVVAGRPGAQALLDEVQAVIVERFWSEAEGALCESFSRDWQHEEHYRGANSNMHGTEAFLALADVTGNAQWLDRALRIIERLIHQHAATNDFQVIEHFSRTWQPLPDYNRDNPADPFRPYGTTPGHGFEWARLLLHLEAALLRERCNAPGWLAKHARELFDSACRHGWQVDGAPGIVYTLDEQRRPVIRQRLHWTHCEAVAAAAALLQHTGEEVFEQWYRRFWEFNETRLMDYEHGSWHHELDELNRPAAIIWEGKPDLYHAYQAVLLPLRPLAPSLASGLAGKGAV
ncbi:N-acylglucosamine 2-epimerase (GlcNAc 2-epimerase) superfamily protein [Pseudomonas sp. StFLB209]|uniref:D-mannose isomerase n=1 Tax=Pseudomonas sp. StFLB209 TaxID=1028989 RepID=UPI0004F63300|nr:AGE family epimerase/isomerase [Pseudomonas sp. StFLB209]BAP45911.1 N-acylglucosamine 2-epimerase (GlcNAc 2-epimerase) superfamily protein [Pseudomonas sp. StFLB209]